MRDMEYLGQLSKKVEDGSIVEFASKLYDENKNKIDDLEKQVGKTIKEANDLVLFFGETIEDRPPNELFIHFS